MSRLFKLVAAALALGLLASPAAALVPAICSANSAGHTEDGCPADCPMMSGQMHHTPAHAIGAQAQSQSCCRVSTGRPESSSLLQVPSATVRITAPNTQSIMAVVVRAVVSPTISPPLTTIHSSQAVLCTFLI